MYSALPFEVQGTTVVKVWPARQVVVLGRSYFKYEYMHPVSEHWADPSSVALKLIQMKNYLKAFDNTY